MPVVFVILAGIFAGAYAAFSTSASLFGRIFYKATAGVMLILVVVSGRIGANGTYYALILIGLCFALAGDILFTFTGTARVYMVTGMVCFFCTYLLYIIAFWTIAAPGIYDGAFFILLTGVGIMAFKIRSTRKERLDPLVAFYAIFLCAMAARAFAMLFVPEAGTAFAVCAASGGVLFALSDMLLAFEKFRNRFGRAAGILSSSAYYGGQALIALTVSLLNWQF